MKHTLNQSEPETRDSIVTTKAATKKTNTPTKSSTQPVAKTATKKIAAKKPTTKKLTAKKSTTKVAVKKTPSGKKSASKKATVSAIANGKSMVGVDLSFIGSKDEIAESRNVASRLRVRSKIDNDVEAFLSSGGEIANIEPNVMADPPRKPESNYGSRPI